VNLTDLREWACVDRFTVAVLKMVEQKPANDVAPASGRRRKKWSDTLRSADLAEALKAFRE